MRVVKFCLFVIISIFSIHQVFANESSVSQNNLSALTYANLESYIGEKEYKQIVIDDRYGHLLSESLVINYKMDELNQYYRKFICRGVYWFNCDANIRHLKEYADIDLSEESALAVDGIESIKGYKVNYTTLGMDNLAHNVSGAILIPQSKKALKGVIIFYHYTVLNNRYVPSGFKNDELNLSKQVAASLASAGYVVVLPDYIGQGDDKSSVHPYILYPQINALSGIYMLRLVAQLQPNIRYALNNQKIPLFITGYSEGASYALWASKILQGDSKYLMNYGFQLTKTAPMSGAYNLSKVTFSFLSDNAPLFDKQPPYFVEDARVSKFIRPSLAVDALISYGHYGLNKPESEIFPASLYECDDCTVKSKSYTLNSLLRLDSKEVLKYQLIYNAAKLAGYGESSSSIVPLVNPSILDSPEFKRQLIDADIYNWKSNSPIDFLTYENDSVVSSLNSQVAYTAMANKNSNDLNVTIIPNQMFKSDGFLPFSDRNVDHGSGAIFMFLFARKSFAESDNHAKGN